MAELQRFGGGLESHRRPAGRRILLPAEAELCNAVGLTEDEYWFFVEQLERYNGQRPKEYELIPDIKNIPVGVIVNLVIGLALSAVSALLAPKPKQQKQEERPQLQTESVQGRSRFAPQQGFDSVQDLASLGAVIPLVFANRVSKADGGDGRGGVRVNSQLVFSQLLSRGIGQRLKALMVFSNGTIVGRPDFAGYAIGDTSLENYTNAKISLYFKDGSRKFNRILEGDGSKYPEATLEYGVTGNYDVFAIWDDRSGKPVPWFSGARTPSTQTQFGLYAPMPNGMRYQLNWELVMVVDGSGKETKKNAHLKQKKIEKRWPYHASIIGVGNPNVSARFYKGQISASNGSKSRWDYIIYKIDADEERTNDFEPWGVEDVNQATSSARIEADDSISLGEMYMAGDALLVCTDAPTDIWELGKSYQYRFDCIEPGFVESARNDGTIETHDVTTLQRCAIGTVTNTRACIITEIGLKSVVWKQINGFANVNSYPGKDVQGQYEKEGGQLSIGTITKYIRRLSFFRLEMRRVGDDAKWEDVTAGNVFCVQGQTPQAQYNFIRVRHPSGQWEFRLKPFPGVMARREYTNQDVFLMNGRGMTQFNSGGMTVTFSGERTRLTGNLMSNPEWILGNTDRSDVGRVRKLSRTQQGNIPTRMEFVKKETRYEYDGEDQGYGYYIKRYSGDYNMWFRYIWNDDEVADIEVEDYHHTDRAPIVTDKDDGDIQYRPGAAKRVSDEGVELRWEIERWALEQVSDNPVFDGTVNASGGSGSGLSVKMRRWANGSAEWEIADDGRGYKTGDSVTFYSGGQPYRATVTADDQDFLKENLLPYDAINDYFKYQAENASHNDGPEHEVVYVNEQLENDRDAQYGQLAYAGLRMDSSVEWNQFSTLSAYFKTGVELEKLTKAGSGPSHLLPEIVYGLLTNTLWGAGKLVGPEQVDRDRMATAAKFCEANCFYWDGVLDQRQNIREWIFTQAGYCMLDFTILGGRFSLVPSVPTHTSGKINYNGKPDIKALFTDGNMRNMEVVFLAPEERQLFKAVCLWRQEKENGFPQTRVLTARFSNAYGGSSGDPEETFDMSGFCTHQSHALKFAKYALKVRREIDHSIKFETTPQAAMTLAPGDYFRVVSEATHTDRFQCGSVDEDGNVTAASEMKDGTYDVMYWKPGTEGTATATINIKDGKTGANDLLGTVFAILNNTTKNRVYKVETLSYADDGLVEITGSFAPLTDKGSLAVLDWKGEQFVIETG